MLAVVLLAYPFGFTLLFCVSHLDLFCILVFARSSFLSLTVSLCEHSAYNHQRNLVSSLVFRFLVTRWCLFCFLLVHLFSSSSCLSFCPVLFVFILFWRVCLCPCLVYGCLLFPSACLRSSFFSRPVFVLFRVGEVLLACSAGLCFTLRH